MAAESYTTKRTFAKVGTLLDNALYLLERLNDSWAIVFLLLREVSQPVHVSEIIKRTKVSRRQVYRALQFLKSVDLADHVHGYWYEKITRQL